MIVADVSPGARLRILRKAKGYSLRAFARVTRIPLSSLHLIEEEQRQLRADQILECCRVLGCTADALLAPTNDKETL